MGILKTIKPVFWLANGMEACERLAYFGIRAILPLMMVSVGTGGLGLSMSDKGIILGLWALIQCIVPMVSGGFSESFGYKKSLIIAFIINIFGYLLMANITNITTLVTGSTVLTDPFVVQVNFWLMLLAGCTIGVGTAIFKPPVGGVVAKSLDDSNSGLGFGIYYWVVNIGGFLAPMAASALRGTDEAPTWDYVFYGAAFVTVFNLLITLILFKEPSRECVPVRDAVSQSEAISAEAASDASTSAPESVQESEKDASETASQDALSVSEEATDHAPASKDTVSEQASPQTSKKASKVFVETLAILWNDKMTLLFLLIVSGFWLMFMQLWDLLPNFLDEWVDRRSV